MNEMDVKWQRLVKVARQAPEQSGAEMPFGFATRVVARSRAALRQEVSIASVWESFSRRALIVGCAIMIVSLTAGYGVMQEGFADPLSMPDTVLESILEP